MSKLCPPSSVVTCSMASLEHPPYCTAFSKSAMPFQQSVHYIKLHYITGPSSHCKVTTNWCYKQCVHVNIRCAYMYVCLYGVHVCVNVSMYVHVYVSPQTPACRNYWHGWLDTIATQYSEMTTVVRSKLSLKCLRGEEVTEHEPVSCTYDTFPVCNPDT